MRRTWIQAILILSVCTIIGGCGAKKDLDATVNAVTLFHSQLDSQNYTAIYAQADQRLRDASKQDEFLALLGAINRKLGTVQRTERRGFYVNWNISGTQTRVTYATKFTGGDAMEQFVWAKDGDRLRLLGYNIHSNALITK